MVYYNKEEITFQSLIMKQVQKLQEITSKELRDGEKIVKNLIGEQTIEGEDTRYSYLQSVDMLGCLLSPYFKKIENVDYAKEYEAFCELYDIELIEALDNEDFQDNVKEYFKIDECTIDSLKNKKLLNEVNIYLLNYKVREGRIMFRLLFKLIKENDYFGSTSFSDNGGMGEGEQLEAIDEDDDDAPIEKEEDKEEGKKEEIKE